MTDLLPAAATRNGGEPQTDGAVRARVVLDTSVLIADPSCVISFDGIDVVVPLIVVEELDGLKTRPDDVGRAAPHRAAHDRGDPRPPRRLAGRPGAGRQRGDAADRAQRHPEAPARRARAGPGELGQPHHRRRPRPGRSRSHDDGVERRRAAHQGRSPRRRRRPARAGQGARRHAVRRVVDDRDRPRDRRLPVRRRGPRRRRGRRPRPTSARTSSPCCGPARSRR